MRCGEKIRELREKSNISQGKLADLLGISLRTMQRYEKCQRIPSAELLAKISSFFGVTSEEMLSDEDVFITEASKLGPRSALQAMELVNAMGALFAGGELSEQDMDAAMQALMDAYWEVKRRNKAQN